ncbi:GNAT family N-acetyltransferase [Aminobacter ciceronei]|jgi:putative acetyltransferase|uniref:Acetyltransferase n=1 Tax=Aminobacter ciceronei TaxID=150723 RepID=A0ABR6CI79_9HYPH|nr:N-acetyltransferase [Aminobacter ciceronei]MBA8910851.1 putative acetyltransferase [Aminobacter ciceronei]MBA9024624.1 putative acetyltransferase [Aminobacter ciceronei]
MYIRSERPADVDTIRALTRAAFADALHSSQTEAAIVDALRDAGALTLSLIAEDGGKILGHVAFSPVTVGGDAGWYGLGPVSVWPDNQGKGIGQALIRLGLDALRGMGAKGCVLIGDPAYYSRFGFVADPAVTYDGLPPQYVQRLAFGDTVPGGEIVYHAGFEAS